MIKNAEFSGYYFQTNLNKWGDFQICISVPLRKRSDFKYILQLLNICLAFKFIQTMNFIQSRSWYC